MHRATPSNSSFRGYSSGGSRVVVQSCDDSKLMQEHKGNMMHNEQRDRVESPQNYGFTSVCMDADQNGMGPETFHSYMGGNRSFPVGGNMDDRRHRLYKLEKGDSAMFPTRQRKQQLHMNNDGGFWMAPRDKTVRMGLLDEDSEQQQQGGQSGGSSGGSGGGSSGGGVGQSGGGGQGQMGQEAKYKDQQKTYRFVHCTKDETAAGGKSVKDYLEDGKAYRETTGGNVYLGADSKANQAIVITVKGPAKNTLAQV